MKQGKVEICGVNTSKLPLLKSEEKELLFQQIAAGDLKVLSRFTIYTKNRGSKHK